MTDPIHPASTPADYAAFGRLIREYLEWCRERYREQGWFVERVFGYQALEEELGSLAIAYGSPNGITLLAKVDGEICGGGAYRRLGEGVCEMKRLFVSDRFKGRGIGRQLCAALIESARAEGFELMRLDTANLLTEAIALYRSVGFQVCEPYRDYPEDLMPFLVFMELSLGGKG